MTSKSQARRNKRQHTKPQEWPSERDAVAIPTQPTSRPTDQRLARGHWASGDTKPGSAYVDLASDMIGRLLVEGKISQQQAQAARSFSEAQGAYRSEIGISESKSCLAESSGGFDASDGNPEIYKRYNKMTTKLGYVRSATLRNECNKMARENPRSLDALRNALDCLAG
jgi:hypothetical protein